MSLPDQNVLTCICDYFMKKCLEKCSCDARIDLATFPENLRPIISIVMLFKAYINK